MFLIKTFKWNYHTFTWIYMKLVYQNTISRLYEKIIGNLSNVHTQDLNDFIYSAQMKGLHQFHIILQSTYMKFSYTRHIPSYTLQQCNADLFSMMFEKEIIKNRAEALLWLRGYNISSLFKADLITLDICRHTQTPITYSSIGNSTQACLILSVTSHEKIFL